LVLFLLIDFVNRNCCGCKLRACQTAGNTGNTDSPLNRLHKHRAYKVKNTLITFTFVRSCNNEPGNSHFMSNLCWMFMMTSSKNIRSYGPLAELLFSKFTRSKKRQLRFITFYIEHFELPCRFILNMSSYGNLIALKLNKVST
jgi:hypothetical protein